MRNIQKTYALIIGIILIIIAIWGFFVSGSNLWWGTFGTNYVLSIIYLIGGLFGIYSGVWGRGYMYNMTIGWIGIIMGILGFIPGIDSVFTTLFGINTATNVLHLAIGIISLIIAYSVDVE